MAPAQKPWRDWAYLAIIGTQLFGMLVLDLVEFYPKSLWQAPSSPLHFLVSLRKTYVSFSGDPYFAHKAGAAAHEPWFQMFLYIEALVQLPLAAYLVSGLASARPTTGAVELAALVFGSVTAMGASACCFDLSNMGPGRVNPAQKGMLLYGTYLPFAIVPAAMAIDMYLRLLPRVDEADEKEKKQ